MIHVDVKKLGRIQGGAGHRITGHKHTHTGRDRKRHVGWEYVHVCIDDATRLAYVDVLADEKATTAIGFLRRARCFYAVHGIEVQRLMTDNGPAYISVAHALACRALGLPTSAPARAPTARHPHARGRWAYRAIYARSQQRTDALPIWLEHYNYRRSHGALSHHPPAARLAQLTGNNLHGSYTGRDPFPALR